MEKSLIFINKPTILIYLDDISEVQCNRISESSQRFFEMNLHLKKKDKESVIYEFNNIEKKEYDCLGKYFKEKKIKFSSDDDQGSDVITTKKVRKAPEPMEIDLPSEEDEFDDDFSEGDADEDFENESDGEKGKKEKSKKDKPKKKKN